jgi:Gas vesicle synthesis protein GvpL/GvpF
VPESRGNVYVYGVLAASDKPRVSAPGVKGAGVRTIRHADVAALVSDLDDHALAAAREMRAHWEVLEDAARTATVIPVRFGTTMESDSAVREHLLEPNAERLGGLLRELAGRVQLSVKGDYDEERLLRDVIRESPAVADVRERLRTLPEAAGYYERIRLGELVAAEIAHRQEKDSALALERLEPLAVASRAEEARSSNTAFNLAFLVMRDRLPAFSAGVRALVEEMDERIRIRYVGPLPPYSFADAELTSGSAAWA